MAARELLIRRRMRESILGFSECIEIPGAPIDFGGKDDDLFEELGSNVAAHHVLLMNAIQECMETPYGRLMVFMPPGGAKSTYCTVVGPAWYMGKYPRSQIILGSYNTELAKKQGARARSIVQQPIYQAAFRTHILPETTAKEMWALDNGSEYMSAGLTSGITGNRADGVVVDDPVKGRADSKSPTIQMRTLEAFNDDVKTRLKPRAWVIVVQTRWDMNDLSGNILPDDWDGESGRILCKDGLVWNVLCLVAKIETEKQQRDDPLGRKIGEYLWPEWFDAEHWKQFEPRPDDPHGPSQISWDSLFQQRPKGTIGVQFEREWFNRYDIRRVPQHLMLISASDYAVTSKDQDSRGDPDFTEHGIAGLDEFGDLWIVDWWYGQEETDNTIDELLNLAKRHNVRNGFGEMGIIRRAVEPFFRMRQRQLKYWMKIEYLPHIGDKKAKVSSFRSMAMNGKVHIPHTPWGERLIDQLCQFPDGRDDAVDVCGLLGRGTETMVWSRKKVTRKPSKGVEFGSVAWLELDSRDSAEHPDLYG